MNKTAYDFLKSSSSMIANRDNNKPLATTSSLNLPVNGVGGGSGGSVNGIAYLDLKENHQQRFKPVAMRMNLLKIDMYPDRYSHMKTIRMEYPDEVATTTTTVAVAATSPLTPASPPVMVSATTTSPNVLSANNKPKSNRKTKQRNKLRYMTQPIRLIEIQETEEDLNDANSFQAECNKLKNEEIKA
jgi:hypothetical protein